MPLAPPIAMSQNASANALMLTMDGFDLIKVPGTAPTVGIPLDSIELVEAGPGAVSTLKFIIEDPGTSAPLPQNGSVIGFNDLVNGVPLFVGKVNHWQAIPLGVGRQIIVDCDGPEKVLDNILTVPFTVGIASNLQTSIALLAGVFPLRVSNIALGITPEGTRALPIGQLGAGVQAPFNDAAITVAAGTTFRDAIRQLSMASPVHPTLGPAYVLPMPNLTVDFYYGLRAWDVNAQPDDYATLAITNTGAGALSSVAINFEVHPADIIHELYIAGLNAAASGWFSDGSGIVGQQSYLADSSIDTAAKAANVARAYLQEHAGTVRGTFSLDAFSPPTTWHAGGLLSITDASLGLSAQTYIIQTIRKTFAGGTLALQTWQVDFGGRSPSAAISLRNLTRAVLN